MNKMRSSVMALMVATAFALPGTQAAAVDAARGQAKPAASSGQATPQQARDVRLDRLIGMNVRNPAGESLGEIKDVMLDTGTGQVRYVILEFGGVLGLGEKLFAYPMRAFRTSPDRDDLLLVVDRERLQRAPGFARDNWPDFGQHGVLVDRYWTEDRALLPGQQAKLDARLRRASSVIGMEVDGADGRGAGEIEDVVVSLADGKIRYYVLEFDRSWNLNDRLIVLPPAALAFDERSDNALLRVARDYIERSMRVDRNAWPDRNLNDPRYRADIDRYLLTAVTTVPAAAAGAQQAQQTPPAQQAQGSNAQAAATGAQAMTGAMRGETFESLDVDGDGAITRADLTRIEQALKDWQRLDRDNDGRVTREEFGGQQRR